MKKITINDAILAIEALDFIEEHLPPYQKFCAAKVRNILIQSIELARPLLTGDQIKDQWLSEATTLPFEPLVLRDIFSKQMKIEPSRFLAIKRICE